MTSPERPGGRPLTDVLHEVPLRLRLVAVTVGLLVTALSIAGLATSVMLQESTVAQKGDELALAAPALIDQATREFWGGTDLLPARVRSYNGGTFVVTLARHGVREPVGEPDHPAVPALRPDSPQLTAGRPYLVPSADGTSRWLARSYADPRSADGVVTVALPLASSDRTVERLRWWTVGLSVAAAAVSALLGWFLIRRAFRPLTQIEDTAKAIAGGDLTRRVPTPPTRDEVASLSHSFNTMLARIEESFAAQAASEERMRRFVADASHELRTPLATMRGYAELYRQGAVREPEDVASSMRRIEGEAVRMSALVEDLLLLTRLDHHDPSPVRPTALRSTDLTVLAADAVQDAQARDPERTIRLVGLDGPLRPTTVTGDESQLRQVLTNLLANAIRHTPAGTPIEVATGTRGSTARMEVRDHGPGIPPEHRRRVFERFYRADASRNSSSGGTGLGLSIVSAIVERHGGQVAAVPTPGGGATVVVDLPAAGAEDVAPETDETRP